MRNSRAFCVFALVLFGVVASAQATVHDDFEKTLELVRLKFKERYALEPWKTRIFRWSIDGAAKSILREGKRDPNLTEGRARVLIQEYFYSARDYHAKAIYSPGGFASLPVSVRAVRDRVFISEVDEACNCSINVGDELVAFDGVKGFKAVLAGVTRKFPNHFPTDIRHGERRLTEPYGMLMERMPTKETAELTVKDADGKQSVVTLTWTKSFTSAEIAAEANSAPTHARISQNLQGWLRADAGVGGRASYFPKPAKVLWESAPGARIRAWIADMPGKPGKKIGWVRIASFSPGQPADYTASVKEFEATIAKMNADTDALIVDELGNPGGMADYMYALASYFYAKEVPTFKFSYRLFDAILKDAGETLPELEKISTDDEAKAFFGGDDYFGYPVDLDFAKQTAEFYRGLVEDGKAGLKYGKFRNYNASRIKPNPRVQYLKPIFVLADANSVSCGDFFPALIQDTKRGEVLGGWTAGAGAFTGGGTSIQAPLKTNTLIVPIALGLRLDNRTPIENFGVFPTRWFSPTKADYRNGYRDYGDSILKYISKKL